MFKQSLLVLLFYTASTVKQNTTIVSRSPTLRFKITLFVVTFMCRVSVIVVSMLKSSQLVWKTAVWNTYVRKLRNTKICELKTTLNPFQWINQLQGARFFLSIKPYNTTNAGFCYRTCYYTVWKIGYHRFSFSCICISYRRWWYLTTLKGEHLIGRRKGQYETTCNRQSSELYEQMLLV